MYWPQTVMTGGSVMSQLLKFEDTLPEYEWRSGQTLQEELRLADVFQCGTGQLKTWLHTYKGGPYIHSF